MTDMPIGVWLDAVYDSARNHRAVKHEFLAGIATGKFSDVAVAHVVMAYATYSAEFPVLVSQVLDDAPRDGGITAMLSEVMEEELVDEHGHSHAQLLRETANSLTEEFNRETLSALEGECASYAATAKSIAREGFGQGLGVLGPATEWIVPDIYRHFVDWFRDCAPGHATDTYFGFHIEADDVHARLLRDAIAGAVGLGVATRAQIAAGTARSLAARAQLWDRLSGHLSAWDVLRQERTTNG